MYFIHKQYLKYGGETDYDGTDWSARAIVTTGGPGSDGIYYSDPIRVRKSEGFSSLRIVSTASIDIAYQVSDDNITWDDPVDTDANALGTVAAALTTTGQRRFFDPVITEWLRFKITCNSNATTTFQYIQKES